MRERQCPLAKGGNSQEPNPNKDCKKSYGRGYVGCEHISRKIGFCRCITPRPDPYPLQSSLIDVGEDDTE